MVLPLDCSPNWNVPVVSEGCCEHVIDNIFLCAASVSLLITTHSFTSYRLSKLTHSKLKVNPDLCNPIPQDPETDRSLCTQVEPGLQRKVKAQDQSGLHRETIFKTQGNQKQQILLS